MVIIGCYTDKTIFLKCLNIELQIDVLLTKARELFTEQHYIPTFVSAVTLRVREVSLGNSMTSISQI